MNSDVLPKTIAAFAVWIALHSAFELQTLGQNTPGALDLSFGTGGKVVTSRGNSNGRAFGMALQRDGKAVVVGAANNGTDYDFAVLRYNVDGSLDGSFGNQGIVTTPVGKSHDYAWSVAVQTDGSILVAGSAYNGTNSDIALVCYWPDGRLNPFFGTGGKVVTAVRGTSGEIGRSVALLKGGKILVAGYTDNGTVKQDIALIRYDSSGQLDPEFGTNGIVTTDFGGTDDYGASLLVQRDGKIVVAGYSKNSGGNNDFAMVRYNPEGTLDTTFGTGGRVITRAGLNESAAQSVTLQDDGKILLAGYASNGIVDDFDFALARYLPDGSRDTTFGSGGQVVTDLAGGSDDSGHSVTVQSDGKIVVAGSSGTAGNYDFALVRYNADGSLDTTFGNGGKVITPVGSSDDFGWSVAVQSDGKLLVSGDTRTSSGYDFALVRFLGTTQPEIAVEQQGGINLTDGISTVNFGDALKITMSPACLFTVKNPSTATLTGLAVTKDGVDASEFLLGALGATTLGPGESTTFSVVFIPAGVGLRSATVHIASNDADENPFDIALAGTVITAPDIVTTSPLPSGMVGEPYSFTLQASGGALPYNWAIYSGLPAGLSLSSDGVLSGTPVSATTTNFNVRAFGSDGSASTKETLALTIMPPVRPGDLDPSFGTNGKVITDISGSDDDGYSVAVQPDGKIVVAGYSRVGSYEDFAVARYLADGSLDPSFGNGGKVTTDLSLSRDFGRSVALQRDGKILVAGESWMGGSYKFSLLRYEPDGTLDDTFGRQGRMTNSIGSGSYCKTVMVQSHGGIVLAGEVDSPTSIDFGAARVVAGGYLDTTFGAGGVVATDFGIAPRFDYAQGAVLQSDDKVLVVGYVPGTNGNDFGVLRYLANGTLDASFGNGGKVSTSFSNGGDLGRCVAVQPDGKILAAGEVANKPALARYHPGGTLDTTFGTDGKVVTNISRFETSVRGVVAQPDGKIVVAGYAGNGSNYDFAMARFLADGVLDPSFGTAGVVVTPIGPGHDYGRSIVLQRDGRILVAGSAYNGTNFDFALVRYIGSLVPDIAVEQPAGTNLTDGSSSVSFGNVALGGAPVVRTFTLKNIGTATLGGLAITTDGANARDFTVQTLPTSSLAPGANTIFSVVFAPTSLGSRTATIHIASNDADENPFDITLTGTSGSLTPLQTWRLAHFGSADNSGDGADSNDFDKDGVVNLLEYALGGDPKIPDAAALRPTAVFAAGKLQLSFPCDARCTDITYTVQAASSLESAAWTDIARSIGGGAVTPVGSLSEVLDPAVGLRTVTVAPSATLFPTGQAFLRLKISE